MRKWVGQKFFKNIDYSLWMKPSRKISREGNYLVVQERIGVLMSQTGAQQVRKNRYLINSNAMILSESSGKYSTI